MGEISVSAVNKDNGCVEVCTASKGEWPAAAIVAAFEGFGNVFGIIVESTAEQLKNESRNEFVMDCCVALNKKLMVLSEKY